MKFKKSISLVCVAVLTLVSAGRTTAQEGPPAPLPLEAVSFPEFHERQLSNGARVIIVENHEQPVVSVNLRIKSGSAYDPDGRAGLAVATASLLNKGTPTRDAKELAEAIDFVGGSLSASAGEDWTSATTTVLTEFLDTGLELLGDIVINPTFPEDEIEIERKRVLSALQVELSQPASVATRRFVTGLYGDHPYGNLTTEESAKAIQRSDMVAFHREHYRPDNALFVVAGDVKPGDIMKRLEKYFSDWKPGAVQRVAMAAPPGRSERQIRLYHKPGSVQAVARVGHLMESATDPDWVALDVAIRVLGGGSQGWLYRTLREDKGYTYGSYATSAKRIDRGYFQAWAEVRNEVTDSAMTGMFELLDRIRDERVPEKDLNLAKDFMTGSFPRQIETPQQVAGRIATARLRRLPKDYLEKYRERVAAVDAAEVQRVTRKHLHPERALVVVVGDASEIYDKLSAFGDVELYDVEGNPLTLADLEVKAAEVTFDPSVIEPTTLVYSLNFQGNPIGESTTDVTRESVDGREVIKSNNKVAGMGFDIEQELTFDAQTFAGISAHIQQQGGGTTMTVDLQLDAGKLTGTFNAPDGSTTEVDEEVVAGTLLPGMDDYAIWLADLSVGAELKIPAYSVQAGGAYTLTIKVARETTVNVAAGEFEVYELQVSGAQANVTIFARKEAPHYLIKQELTQPPLVFELKEIR